MYTLVQTDSFARWLDRLADRRARARIAARLDIAAAGHLGDWKSVGEGVSELRIDYGPGYRVYFARRGQVVLILLAGGDKSSQRRDIANAQALARQITLENDP